MVREPLCYIFCRGTSPFSHSDNFTWWGQLESKQVIGYVGNELDSELGAGFQLQECRNNNYNYKLRLLLRTSLGVVL